MNTPGSLSYINGLRELTVLVIDGDPASTQRLTLQLEEAHCEVVCLSGHAEASAYLPSTTRRLDLVLVDSRLPHLARLVCGLRALPAACTLPLYLVAGSRLHEHSLPADVDGLLPKPLPIGAALYSTLRDLLNRLRGGADPFMPLEQAAAQVHLTVEQALQQFYAPILAGVGRVVRAADVAVYDQFAGGLDYADPIQQAFSQGAWRDLSWRARACLFNRDLPPALRLHWRTLKRIAQGQDRELARAIRVLTALDLKLGLDIDALANGTTPATQEATA